MPVPFEPIAIVGAGCILPGCGSPEALWRTVGAGLCQITAAPAGDWRADPKRVLATGETAEDRAWTDRGGYVGDVPVRIDPGADLDPDLVAALDPVFRWTLHAAGQALAGVSRPGASRGGLALANLSYPTRLTSRLLERQWVDHALGRAVGSDVHPLNRFMSGAPALMAARAFGLGAGAFALDAACASGLYAIKSACDRLQAGRADLMLAGSVNAADPMYLHVGFTALNALSRSGRSRPFHRDADGLLPAEGAAFVALKRLGDALGDGDRVLGVIRGLGLSNDGRSGGFLAPSQEGQMAAMRAALAQARMSAEAVQYVECHATGTRVGDAVEIASLSGVYGATPLALGSLKANLGHLITAASIAGLIKVLGAMEHGVIPPTPGSRPLSDAFAGLPFAVPDAARAWEPRGGQRTAAISGFGFGGNNAHLILDQRPAASERARRRTAAPEPRKAMAVVGLAVRTHLDPDADAFGRRVLGGQAAAPFAPEVVTLGARQIAFPPAELKKALGQQLAVMETARRALGGVALDRRRTGVFVGMQTDPRVSRNTVRIRWPDLMAEAGVAGAPAWVAEVAGRAGGPLDSATVVGRMPNITANRLSNLLDLRGPSHAVSAEELSGDEALDLAVTALERGDVDAALVGAVDIGREPLNAWACRAVLGGDRVPADAAVMLVLKDPERARADGDAILGLVAAGGAPGAAADLSNAPDASPLTRALGHAHAASGLLHLALGLQMLGARTCLDGGGTSQPLLARDGATSLQVQNVAFTGQSSTWTLGAAPEGEPLGLQPATALRRYAAADRASLIEALRADRAGGEGPCRLALVGGPEQLDWLRRKALQGLSAWPEAAAWALDGISFRAAPVAGDLAFAFTGAAAAYPGMGRALLLGAPRLGDALAKRMPGAAGVADWIWRDRDARGALPFHQLAGSSYLCQLHAVLSQEVLKLKPRASLGLSSGETNAMFAFGLWRDFAGLLGDIERSGLYERALAGRFDAVREHWGEEADAPVRWVDLRVKAPSAAVREAVAGTPRAYLTIVNGPDDCVISGDVRACEAVLRTLGGAPAVPLGHGLAVHCEAVLPFEAAWRAVHTRETRAAPDGVRFYANAFGGPFEPDEASVADALTGQALRTVDFPTIVERAWADGVRVFVEHGPRGSLAGSIGEILAGRDHLAVSLDRFGVPSDVQAWRAAAELWCAGVEVDVDALSACFRQAATPEPPEPPHLHFHLKPLEGDLPNLPPLPKADTRDGRRLPRAPRLAAPVPPGPAPAPRPRVPAPLAPAAGQAHRPAVPPAAGGTSVLGLATAHRRITDAHTDYMRVQAGALQAYGQTLLRVQAALFAESQPPAPDLPEREGPVPPPPAAAIVAKGADVVQPTPAAATEEPEIVVPAPAAAPRGLPGPKFGRAELEVLAGGRISSVFGPSFAGQDRYAVQVRMPEPPLLLCDRVLGIEGEAHGMGRGTIWTETDVCEDGWRLHHGRMPPGFFIECGQADLLLISWLGVDALNKGERAYRLLGCELVFEGGPPEAGDTLEYEIHVDGHAKQGDVRLFFFNYECRIRGERRIAMRNGQAGFFTQDELENSGGVIWSAETANYGAAGRVAPAPEPTAKTRFSRADVQAYLDGDLVACFGPAFFWADTHTRTPATPADRRNYLGEVAELDFGGGPAGRGYLRVETEVSGREWFFDGHFKADPCMPGTLMADACLQAMAFYLVATGRTLHRDGWRFQPVGGEPFTFLCRGQVTPRSRRIVYELFVDEIVDDGGMPILRGHVLCSVDGRKAFLCERLALQLVPDWPLASMPAVLEAARRPDPRPVARIGDFPLDYLSLIHCAWGRPTGAFGARFAHYDGVNRPARLPGPPYHFMTRITELSGEMMSMKGGAKLTALYDVPPDAWYFAENGAATMPNCVLLEAALQTCGWLSSYALRREPGQAALLFRNLDGEAVQHREVRPGDRTVTTRAETLSLDRVGDLIITKFKVNCTVDGEPLYDAEAVFGFFPPEAMADQKGFGPDEAAPDGPPALALDMAARPARLFAGAARLPDSKLLMLDRITGYWPEGGSKGLGLIRGERDITPRDWFFKAHFFQDPVQPGSLGVEGMIQLMQSVMLVESMDEALSSPRFEPMALGQRVEWHYRGQVTPKSRRMSMQFDVHERGVDAAGPFVIGRATLAVDGLQIYRAPRLGMRLVEAAPADAPRTRDVAWRLDSEGETAWVKDHRPTYSVPALPFTYELEMAVAAAAPLFPGQQVVGVRRAAARKWVAFPDRFAEGRTRVAATGPASAEVTLQVLSGGDLQTAFTAEVLFGAPAPAPEVGPLPPLRDARPVHDLYERPLFHGPALQLMRDLEQGSNGASGTIDDARCGLPRGLVHPGLLDAALHAIPHDDPALWSPDLPSTVVGYPVLMENLQLFGPLTAGGPMRVEVRLVDVEASRLMRTHVRLLRGGVLWAMFDFTEMLMPKGLLGTAPERRTFLLGRRHVPGIALSEVGEATTTLSRQACAESDWLPGTVASLYRLAPGEDIAAGVAMRDHAAAQLRLHPGDLSFEVGGDCCNLPLNPWRLRLEDGSDGVMVRSDAPGDLDWRRVRDGWRALSGGGQTFVEDLGIALIRRFVRRVVLADPAGFAALAGRPVLFLANHQTGVESTLFLMIAVAMAGLPAGAVAKTEHAETWVGKIRALADAAMGDANPMRLHLFDRSKPADLIRLLHDYGEGLARRPSSLLVHTDGTRAVKAGAPVGAVSSVLVDLSLAHGLPIVPVRFAGGLPAEPAAERLEFPAGAGRQDYFIGPAIAPEVLGALPFGERSAFVRDRINALGPRGADDAPLPGDRAFAAEVAAGRSRGLDAVQSHLRAALAAFPDLGEQGARLLRDPGADASAPVAALAPHLIGAAAWGPSA